MPFSTMTLGVQSREFKKVYTETAKVAATTYNSLFNEVDIDREYDLVKALGPFGAFSYRGQFEDSVEDTRLQHFSQTIQTENWSKKWRSSWQNEKEDPNGSAKDLVRQATYAKFKSIDALHFDVFNRALNTSYLGPDGDPLVDADHVWYTGSDTYSNLETASALSEATLETAIQNARAALDARGRPLSYMGSFILLVPPALAYKAQKLKVSLTAPESDNGAKNVVGVDITVKVSPYLTDTNAWFLIPAQKEENPLNTFWFKRHYMNHEANVEGDLTSVMGYQLKTFWTAPILLRGNEGA